MPSYGVRLVRRSERHEQPLSPYGPEWVYVGEALPAEGDEIEVSYTVSETGATESVKARVTGITAVDEASQIDAEEL